MPNENIREVAIIDNGSGYIKAGFSGEDTPRSYFMNAVADEKSVSNIDSALHLRSNVPLIGSHIQEHDHRLLMRPIQRGQIVDWEKMEQVWAHTLSNELGIDPDALNMPVMLIDSPNGEKSDRENIAKIMFESFRIPHFYVVQQCVLSLFASGRTRGIVLECGHGATHSVPIFEGYTLPHATLRMYYGGEDITTNLQKMLCAEYSTVDSLLDSRIVERIKESACLIQSVEGEKLEEATFELPDGSSIQIRPSCRSSAAEPLFNPSMNKLESVENNFLGIHNMIQSSITMCDKDLQKDLLGSVVMAGGTSMLPGFSYRMNQELCKMNQGEKVRIVPSFAKRERGYNSHRKIAAWVGGSMFASLSTFSKLLISKQDWEECGESVIHRKCF